MVLGIAAIAAARFLTGSGAAQAAATTAAVSVLCVQPTSVGWLCKEIIKIFRLRGSAGPALKATQAAGNNRNPPLKTFRTGLFACRVRFSRTMQMLLPDLCW